MILAPIAGPARVLKTLTERPNGRIQEGAPTILMLRFRAREGKSPSLGLPGTGSRTDLVGRGQDMSRCVRAFPVILRRGFVGRRMSACDSRGQKPLGASIFRSPIRLPGKARFKKIFRPEWLRVHCRRRCAVFWFCGGLHLVSICGPRPRKSGAGGWSYNRWRHLPYDCFQSGGRDQLQRRGLLRSFRFIKSISDGRERRLFTSIFNRMGQPAADWRPRFHRLESAGFRVKPKKMMMVGAIITGLGVHGAGVPCDQLLGKSRPNQRAGFGICVGRSFDRIPWLDS